MPIPIIFCLLIIFILWFYYKSGNVIKSEKKKTDAFWKKEQEANGTRKVDISNLDYILIPINSLPFAETTDESLITIQDTIRKISQERILNLTGLSNTDLKLQYGASNLTLLSTYDQNYTLFVRTLNSWATYLYEHSNISDAKIILEYAVQCKSDISNTYVLLANIYQGQGQQAKITELIEQAEGLKSLMKDHIILALKELLS